ncbi:Secreted protein containing DUF1552 [Planctomycetales bacterium 10988]|nr:Secreted protein containing DUF1552 [Planctomycetales bacterium 10988]
MHYSKAFSRRSFLRGTGGSLLALPYLNIMADAATAETVPMRMVCVGTTYGFVPKLFFPQETGKDYALPPLLKPLARHRENFTVFSQLDHGVNGVGGHQGVHSFLSGILSKNSKGFREQNISIDQKAAEFVGASTRYPSMQITSGSDPNNLLSWTSAGVAIPPVQDLRMLHALLFQRSSQQERSVLKQLHQQQQSILDLVRTDAEYLQKRIGREDKEKLEQYFTSVREVELRLTQSAAWLDRPKPKVSYEIPQGANEMDFVDRVPLYYDLIALALQTDSTRVLTLELSDIGGNSGGFPITKGYHQLTHHGKVESYIEELSIIETFHTTQFARFLDKLTAITEPNGKTLLDNTMTLLGSGMGNASSHSNRDLPLLLAGGGFRHGQHLLFEKDRSRGTATPAANLFVSMLQRFGLETDQFNLSTGTLTGLEVAG